MNAAIPPIPPFPAPLEQLAAPGLFEGLGAQEVGAFYRLVRFAWQNACALPAEESLLAVVAGCTSEEWSRLGPRLLLALSARPGASGDGRLICEHALRVQQQLLETGARRRHQTAAATQASVEARRRGPAPPNVTSTLRQRDVDVTDPSRSAAPPVRSGFSERSLPAPALQRPTPQQINPSAQGAGREEESVIAVLGDGARALVAQRLVQWRREKSLGMLQAAVARWKAAGLTTCPPKKVGEIAACEHALPARIEELIEFADGRIADAAAKRDARAQRVNPVGIVMHGLGLSGRSGGKPSAIPMWVSQRWAKLEAESVRAMEAQAAISARLAQARAASASSPASRLG